MSDLTIRDAGGLMATSGIWKGTFMYVVVVDIEIHERSVEPFMQHMLRQAKTSLKEEPGCHVFDVSVSTDDPRHVILYEVYADRAAFKSHLAAPYFASFDAAVQALMATKTVRTFERVSG